jgi:hypothetical protein
MTPAAKSRLWFAWSTASSAKTWWGVDAPPPCSSGGALVDGLLDLRLPIAPRSGGASQADRRRAVAGSPVALPAGGVPGVAARRLRA